MTTTHASTAAAIRARLDHPIIDADGHVVEFQPAFLDSLKQIGGARMVERFRSAWERGAITGPWHGWFTWNRMPPEERFDTRTPRPPWWALPTKNTLDRATATLPKLLYERLDELGMDFTILYPTQGLFAPHLEDEELRRVACRAFNACHADIFRDYADRMTPAALIPMHSPQEAIDELDYAVKTLGLKIVAISHVVRPIPSIARTSSAEAVRRAFWVDTFGIDSAYDYDPVWAKCMELQVVPTSHGFGNGLWRQSISSFVYNHIGSFSSAQEAVCKSLFLGGVTRRFPMLKFAFLEGGVGWACTLYADLFSHWEKRGLKGLEDTDPANLNRELLIDLYRRYGGKMMEGGRLEQAGREVGLLAESREDPAMLDEFAACRIERAEDIHDLFVPHFYFGCEADDRINAWAFNTAVNRHGARLKVLFSSDIGHFDVPDMAAVVPEAYELLETGLITEADFRDFMFANPVTLYTSANPDFFTGTVIEQEVKKLLVKSAACH
jgi:predicted TIM-barrel fold metal-dependent hydrolase